MSVPTAFKYNQDAKYRVSGVNETKHQFNLVNQDIQVNKNDNYAVRFPSIWDKYKLPKITDSKVYDDWLSNQMQFWQNQLNFAVWCATTGCGISKYEHLQHKDPMIRSVFSFHVYYQIRRILNELVCPLPFEESFNPLNNGIDLGAFERICSEFGIPVITNFRQKLDYSNGMGNITYYYKHHVMNRTGFKQKYVDVIVKGNNYNPNKNTRRRPEGGSGDPSKYLFKSIEQTFRKQSDTVDTSSDGKGLSAISSFILDYSNGFTQAGVARINDSIRTYAWAILGAQSQARTSILGTGTAFDAQKQFLANVEDAINSAVDLPESITRYQNTLQYARSKVDYVVGQGLYMIPSNMDLHIGTLNGYNNLIMIAPEDLKLGQNDEVNDQPSALTRRVLDAIPLQGQDYPADTPFDDDTSFDLPPDEPSTIEPSPVEPITHDEQKLLLILGGTILGSAAIWALK
jgi:hypothetical protein